MLTSWFIVALVHVASGGSADWRQEDELNHECRTCRDISIDSHANCPEKRYACDERETIRAAVLSVSDPCSCQSLRCANKGWRLAVNGAIVDKVNCKRGLQERDLRWIWSTIGRMCK